MSDPADRLRRCTKSRNVSLLTGSRPLCLAHDDAFGVHPSIPPLHGSHCRPSTHSPLAGYVLNDTVGRVGYQNLQCAIESPQAYVTTDALGGVRELILVVPESVRSVLSLAKAWDRRQCPSKRLRARDVY